MSKKKPQQPNHRPPVTEEEIVRLFGVMIRDRSAYEQGAEFVPADAFNKKEVWLSLIWRVVHDYYKETGHLPTKAYINMRCNAELEVNPDGKSSGDEVKRDKFLQFAFELDAEDMDAQLALETLQKFLEDRLVAQFVESVSLPQTPLALAETFSEMSDKAASFSALCSAELPLPFAVGWEPPKTVERTPTGITFVNDLLRGGTAPGESYGLSGPGGCGKTTLGMMLTVAKAKKEYERWEASGRVGVPGRAYHFAYDDSLDEMRLLFLAHLAEIPKGRLETIIHSRDLTQFSTVGNYQPYERTNYKDQIARGLNPPAELTRFNTAREIINQCSRVVDMTGADPKHPGRGHGMVEEISAIIHHDLTRSGARCCLGVVGDHVNAAVLTHLSHFGKDSSEAHVAIQNWPLNMKRQVAVRFTCPAWSIQPLYFKSNGISRGRLLSMTGSPECGSFLDNCSTCLLLDEPTRAGTVSIWASEQRRIRDDKPIKLVLGAGSLVTANNVPRTTRR